MIVSLGAPRMITAYLPSFSNVARSVPPTVPPSRPAACDGRRTTACITRVINYLFEVWNPPLGSSYVATLIAAQRAVRPHLPRAPPLAVSSRLPAPSP